MTQSEMRPREKSAAGGGEDGAPGEKVVATKPDGEGTKGEEKTAGQGKKRRRRGKMGKGEEEDE